MLQLQIIVLIFLTMSSLIESGQSINFEFVKVSSINNTVNNCSDIYFCETSNVVDIGLNIHDADEEVRMASWIRLNYTICGRKLDTISFNEDETNYNLQIGLHFAITSRNHVDEDTEQLGLSNDIISPGSADRSSEVCIFNEVHDITHPESLVELNTNSVDENFGTISFNEDEINHNLQIGLK